ncbi:MAG TPA: nucleotide sugar dehydrogenase [Nitrososphaera sp.]|nr:nucleotide sugar dehydrogenase [Nitrososphaera sp.]
MKNRRSASISRKKANVTGNDGLMTKIKSGEFKIAIYGLGHVGSPLASAWLRAGAHVIGVDKSPSVLENARKGRTHVPEPGVDQAYQNGLRDKRFSVYDDPVKAAQDSSFKMICVPVLIDDSFNADLGAVRQVATAIGRGMKRGDTVSLNPTVPPGTTEDVVIPVLEKESGMKAEQDFHMIYNPERIYEGRAIQDIEEGYPAVIAGAGPKSLKMGAMLYPMIFKKGVFRMQSIKAAETEKLFEGVYRDVNIALANEMARLCEKIGVNFWEAREAANSQPFCHIHKPGAGVGGACIPVYPQFVLHTANANKIECNITRLGRTVNDSMPEYCVEQALALVEAADHPIVVVLGLAFRGGVSDTRLSPTYKIVEQLRSRGVNDIRVHDPLVQRDPALPGGVLLTSDLNHAVKGANLVILAADHPEYRSLGSDMLGGMSVYDGRGILDPMRFAQVRFASIGKPAS